MSGTPSDLAQLYQELHAASSRAKAAGIFEGADWIFVSMEPREPELAYEKIQDILNEKPEE